MPSTLSGADRAWWTVGLSVRKTQIRILLGPKDPLLLWWLRASGDNVKFLGQVSDILRKCHMHSAVSWGRPQGPPATLQ